MVRANVYQISFKSVNNSLVIKKKNLKQLLF